MARRSSLVVALGVAVVIAGVLVSYMAVRGSGGRAGSADGMVTVLVATKPIPAGTTGANVIAQGAVKTTSVAPDGRPAQALTEISLLQGRMATAPVAAGEVLTADRFPKAQTSIGTLHLPPGKTALALEMANVAGVAGFAGAGDKVDVYGLTKSGGDGTGAAGARLVLQGVDVLNVNGTLLAPTQGQPGGTGLVFLLAVTPPDAERLIYLKTFEQLYFTLVPKDHEPVAPTPGVGPSDALGSVG